MIWEFAALKLDNYISHGLESAIEVRWSYFMPEIIFSNSSPRHGYAALPDLRNDAGIP
jgi:hypothetical protein